MAGAGLHSQVAPVHSARYLVSHRRLLWRITRREWAARYAGSFLGTAWVLLSPLLILTVYGAVYLLIFRVQVPGLTPAQYVLYVFAGLVPYLATGEALTLGVGSVIANKYVLNSTVFPIDLVPAKAVLTSQGTMLVGLALVVGGTLFAGGPSWTLLLLPLLWALHLLALVGVSWVLSLTNVVVRDLQGMLSVALMVLLIASPIAYAPNMVPGRMRVLLLLNPFAYLVTAYQKILVLGELPSLGHSLVLLLVPIAFFVGGGYFFSRAKRVVIDHV